MGRAIIQIFEGWENLGETSKGILRAMQRKGICSIVFDRDRVAVARYGVNKGTLRKRLKEEE